jgi:phage shock protein A
MATELPDDLRAEVERLRADVSRREREHEALLDTAQKALASASVEREAMEEHVGRMQELIDSVATIVGTPGDDPGDIDGFEVLRLHVRATVDALQIARDDADEARGEVERLRRERNKLISERRQLRARLVECRPWVGVLPYPGTPEFNEMIAIRDLADDTLEEVKQ